MKFKIRFADQIVGIASLAAIGGLILVIFAIGAKQNWFTKKINYYTVFDSGSGFSVGMDITYKGFSIGKVKSVSLTDKMVRVDYYVLGDYMNYVKENSLVQLISSPIGLGSSFVLHPGEGKELIPENSEIYRLDSGFGKKIVDEGKNKLEKTTDSIGALMNQVSVLLDNVNALVVNINNALAGNGDTPFTGIIANIQDLTGLLSDPNGAVPGLLGPEMTSELNTLLIQLQDILGNPDGVVPTVLGSQMSGDLTTTLTNISSITSNADKLIGNATPEVTEALEELNTVLVDVQDVLTGVKNNPLIRGGVPDRTNESSATIQLRSTDF